MKIKSIEINEVSIPLLKPFKTALRTVDSVRDVIVTVKTDSEICGYGEAPPTKVITGDTTESIIDALKNHIAPALIGCDLDYFDDVIQRLHSCIPKNTSPKAAVDMALYDIRSKALNVPLYKLLGGYRSELETDLTISVNDADTMVRDAMEGVDRGFKTLKIKVGKDFDGDFERLKRIRSAVGKDIKIRVDANQGWDSKQAVKIIREMEDAQLGLELIEQPVAASDFDGLKFVTDNVDTPILADESVFSVKDALDIITNHRADMINIKLMKTGGIYQALKICNVAEEYGVECFMGCMLESKLAVSAAAHLSAAKKIITLNDLDGPSLCAADPYTGGPTFDESRIILNESAGLGITGIEGLI